MIADKCNWDGYTAPEGIERGAVADRKFFTRCTAIALLSYHSS